MRSRAATATLLAAWSGTDPGGRVGPSHAPILLDQIAAIARAQPIRKRGSQRASGSRRLARRGAHPSIRSAHPRLLMPQELAIELTAAGTGSACGVLNRRRNPGIGSRSPRNP